MENFDYTFNISSKGILSPDEVHFFYYDIMRDVGDNTQVIYEWNDEIEKFLNEKGIKVEVKEKGAISPNSEKHSEYMKYYNVYKNIYPGIKDSFKSLKRI